MPMKEEIRHDEVEILMGNFQKNHPKNETDKFQKSCRFFP